MKIALFSVYYYTFAAATKLGTCGSRIQTLIGGSREVLHTCPFIGVKVVITFG